MLKARLFIAALSPNCPLLSGRRYAACLAMGFLVAWQFFFRAGIVFLSVRDYNVLRIKGFSRGIIQRMSIIKI